MRWLIALLLVPGAFAVFVQEEMVVGERPSLYGDLLAFQNDGEVGVFDFSQRDAFSFGPGANPSLFSFTLVFEDDGVVKYVDLRDKTVKLIGRGRDPVVYLDTIMFSTREKDLQVDFSNDGDLADDIIRSFDIKSGELQNLKAVGRFAVFNQRRVAFLTEESGIGVDLNADGDQKDSVIRILDRSSRQVSNTKVEAQELALGRTGIIAFVAEGRLGVMDIRTEEMNLTDIKATHPSVYDELIVFDHDGVLFGYSAESGAFAQLSTARGIYPSLSGDRVAFVSDESVLGDLNDDDKDGFVIRVAVDEDKDADDVSDFIDNCPLQGGVAQDKNGDGVGDSCGKAQTTAKGQSTVDREPSTVNADVSATDDEPPTTSQEGIAWYWYVLIIAFTVVAGPPLWGFAIRYYRKRRKSFGF